MIYSTIADLAEAKHIAHQLVTQRLVACANIIPSVISIYEWEGKIEENTEVVMIAKAHTKTVDAAIAHIKSLHSYDCPCITAVEMDKADKHFTKWLETSLKLA